MDDRKWTTQIRKGAMDLCVLATLARGERYGYDIVHALSGAEGLFIKEGTIYPLLNRLMADGLVKAEWQPSPQGPKRKYYTLTPAGRKALETMREQWAQFTSDVERILRGEP